MNAFPGFRFDSICGANASVSRLRHLPSELLYGQTTVGTEVGTRYTGPPDSAGVLPNRRAARLDAYYVDHHAGPR